MPSPCLLIGANGQLGSQLLKDLPGHVIGITRADLDLATTDRSSIGAGLGKLLERHQPQLIVNAAAYTAVD
ncbi:MAG: dTDP-4-dehydrorhamnose reductase, partial [Betaproteobacteria bacterium]|nr:dTDP-4-dehydrorhamnose reductase [Betaproteobacteria bacterium]